MDDNLYKTDTEPDVHVLKSSQDVKDEKNKKRILVVDDILIARRFLSDTLEKAGYSVSDSPNGKSTLMLLKNPKNKFDLFIIDIMMPDINGLELIKLIRKMPRYENVPVIICTANGQLNVVKQAKSMQIQGYLIKPINSSMLLKVVQSALS